MKHTKVINMMFSKLSDVYREVLFGANTFLMNSCTMSACECDGNPEYGCDIDNCGTDICATPLNDDMCLREDICNIDYSPCRHKDICDYDCPCGLLDTNGQPCPVTG